jgi:NAD(P)-dependent dehydrogenase (short-subunit alcohol dehydrogenase family)
VLENKVVLVSGVGPGLGSRIAQRAADAGAAVVLAARSEDRLAAVGAQIEGEGGRVAWRRCDITVDVDCDAVVEFATDRFGGVDVLVNNAATFVSDIDRTIETTPMDEWERAIDVNLLGSMRLTKAAIPSLRERAPASIVFVGSQAMRRSMPGRGPYAASKAALLVAAQVLARELGPDRIRVNTVVPGRLWGEPLQEVVAEQAAADGVLPEAVLEQLRSNVALPDLVTDDECARAVVFLASGASAGITGQSLDVNGGETLQ